MSKVIKLKKGLDIKLNGEADKVVQTLGAGSRYALKPTDFRALTPKLTVKVGDEVKAGDALFTDKMRPEVKFTSPVSGRPMSCHRYALWHPGQRHGQLEMLTANVTSSGIS